MITNWFQICKIDSSSIAHLAHHIGPKCFLLQRSIFLEIHNFHSYWIFHILHSIIVIAFVIFVVMPSDLSQALCCFLTIASLTVSIPSLLNLQFTHIMNRSVNWISHCGLKHLYKTCHMTRIPEFWHHGREWWLERCFPSENSFTNTVLRIFKTISKKTYRELICRRCKKFIFFKGLRSSETMLLTTDSASCRPFSSHSTKAGVTVHLVLAEDRV